MDKNIISNRYLYLNNKKARGNRPRYNKIFKKFQIEKR